MAETELTKSIKKRLRYFRPALNSSMRTVRWAEEVETATGFVDVIRFEDYIERDNSYCARITPHERDLIMVRDTSQECKNQGNTFPCKLCHGCVHKKNVHVLGILTTCFEVKITVSDFKSRNGHNFHGNRNYYAVPVDIYEKISPLVPPEIGIIVYYPKSGHLTVKRECIQRKIDAEALSYLLYAALKKWVDGREETRQSGE